MNRLCERTFGAASELESNYNGPFFFFFTTGVLLDLTLFLCGAEPY